MLKHSIILFLVVIGLAACKTLDEDYSTEIFEKINERAQGGGS